MNATRGVRIFTCDLGDQQELAIMEAQISNALNENPLSSMTYTQTSASYDRNDGTRPQPQRGGTVSHQLTVIVKW